MNQENNSIVNELNKIKSRLNNDYIKYSEYEKVKKELDKQIKINEELKAKINELQNLLFKENIKNSDLKKQISNFNEDKKKSCGVYEQLGSKIKDEKDKLNESLRKTASDLNQAQIKIEKYSKIIQNQKNELQKKDRELLSLYKTNDMLKKKLSRFPFELEEGENIVIVIFQFNENQNIHHIISKNTEIFSEIEMRLKNKFPEMKEEEYYYLHNGKKVNKSYNLTDNNIKDGNTIIICKVDD